MTAATSSAPAPDRRRQPLEIGWLLVKPLDEPDRRAVRQAAETCRSYLGETFPEFDWQLTVIGPRNFGIGREASIVATLEQGALERDARGWDFVFVVTGADLESHYKSFAFGATARSLSAAVLSTFRIDPEFSDAESPEASRTQRMAGRVRALFLESFALLNGVPKNPALRQLATPAVLDRAYSYDEQQVEILHESLKPVADLRVEERTTQPLSTFRFYVNAIIANPRAIFGAIRQSNPWLLPIRLSRLTGAAFSALVLLMITAEVWELGLSRSWVEVAGASLLSWLGTTGYVLHRQLRGLRRAGVKLIEHTVQNRVATTVVIAVGMAVAYLLLFATSMLLGVTLFDARLLESWSPSLRGPIGWGARAAYSGTVAAMGLVIGALGASFERQDYFRHVAEIDEEL